MTNPRLLLPNAPDKNPGSMFCISLCPHLQAFFTEDPQGFQALMDVEGEVYRNVKGRRTVRFECGGKRFFIKAYDRIYFGEGLKSLLRLRWPLPSARQEWRGIEAFQKAAVPTMTLAGKGMRGLLPGSGSSFVVTEAVEESISLESLLERQESYGQPQRNRLKRHLIPILAEFSKRLHDHGINHLDFYICHFLTQDRDWASWRPAEALDVMVIDLHRVQIRRGTTPDRWRAKDLGALMFSSFDADLTVTDALRFIRAYYGGAGSHWKRCYGKERGFWFRVVGRALGFQREWDRKQARKALAEM